MKGDIELNLSISGESLTALIEPIIVSAVAKLSQAKDGRDYYYVKEIAAMEGVSVGTITKILRDERQKKIHFPNAYKPGKSWEIPTEDYDNYKGIKVSFLHRHE